MSLLARLIYSSACPSTHHKLAMDALTQLRCAEAEEWQRLFLNYYEGYLRGAKAPDNDFKDYKNHVLHAREGFWGGAISAAQLWYERTVLALRRQYWADAVYAAGVLSHYVTDPCMPLHTGQTEEEGKVHRACEWSVTKSYDELRDILLNDQGGYPNVLLPQEPDWLPRLLRDAATRAHEHYFVILEHYNLAKGVDDPPLGLDQELKDRFAQQIGWAVSLFARVLDRAILDAHIRPPMVELVMETLFATAKFPFRRAAQFLDDAETRDELEEIAEEARETGKVVANLPDDDATVRRAHAEQVLRTTLKQLDAQLARPTGLKHGLGQPARGATPPTRRAGVATGASRLNSPAYRAGSVSSGLGASAAGSTLGTGLSDVAQRVIVPGARPATAARSSAGRFPGRLSRRRRRNLGNASSIAARRGAAPPGAPPPPARPRDSEFPIDDRSNSTYLDPAAAPDDDWSIPEAESRLDLDAPRDPRRRSSQNPDSTRRRHDEGHEEGHDERNGKRLDDHDSAETARARAARREERASDEFDDTNESRDSHESPDDASQSRPPRSRRPNRLGRRLKVEAIRAARAVKRGVTKGITAPAAALGGAVGGAFSKVAQKVRWRRGAKATDAADTPVASDTTEEPGDAPSAAAPRATRTAAERPSRSLRFHLDESHPIVDAPSIGSKTARRLESAGVSTVGELLDADPDELSERLRLSWADAAKIAQWQCEAEFASRIPELRGHDAQILRAVGVTSVDELASMEADDLWELVEPFLDTSDAEQILRGGRRPTRDEVAQWIEWTQSARPRRAA